MPPAFYFYKGIYFAYLELIEQVCLSVAAGRFLEEFRTRVSQNFETARVYKSPIPGYRKYGELNIRLELGRYFRKHAAVRTKGAEFMR